MNEDNIPTVSTDEEARALGPGARFIGPDGKEYKVPEEKVDPIKDDLEATQPPKVNLDDTSLPSVSTDEEARALGPGAKFIGPDGKEYKVPEVEPIEDDLEKRFPDADWREVPTVLRLKAKEVNKIPVARLDTQSPYANDRGLVFSLMSPDEYQKMQSEKEQASEIGETSRVYKKAREVDDNIDRVAKQKNMTRYEYIEKEIIPNMEEGTLKSAFSLVGPYLYDSLLSLGEAFEYVPASATDTIEYTLNQARSIAPESFDSGMKNLFAQTDTRQLARNLVGDIGTVMEISEAAVPVGAAPASLRKSMKKELKLEKIRQKVREKMDRDNALDPTKMNIEAINRRKEAEELASKVANENKDLRNQFIKDYEDGVGETISTKDKDGNIVIDPDKIRNEAREKLFEQEMQEFEEGILREGGEAISEYDYLSANMDRLTRPIIDPDKLNAFVAVAIDMQKITGKKFSKDKPIVDQLFESFVSNDFTKSPEKLGELADLVNKYGMTVDDFMLGVVGSASTAGKVLQKFSQISKAIGKADKKAGEAIRGDRRFSWLSGLQRYEGIRRGGLVSQIPTAARNLTSAYIRAPLDGLVNVMDTALYNAQNKGVMEGASSIVSKQNWADAFRGFYYVTAGDNKDVKGVFNHILDRPEFMNKLTLLTDNINEIQKAKGRGKGGFTDSVLSVGEDMVFTLNVANRWQEQVVRRGTFLAELQRLTRNEYGIDLVKELNDGKIKSLINNSTDVVPTDARRFEDLIADATYKALDLTYSKEPDTAIGREVSRLLVRSGVGTMIMPFPRFMFNQMELIGNYTGGGLMPVINRVANPKKGGLDRNERTAIGRNLVGLAAIGAYALFFEEEAPAESSQIELMSDYKVDMQANSPDLVAFMYLGRAFNKWWEGGVQGLTDWMSERGYTEGVDTFVGVNFRNTMGEDTLKSIQSLFEEGGAGTEADVSSSQRLGAVVGNLISTHFVPLGQVREAQKVLGLAPREPVELREDPGLSPEDAFMEGLSRPLRKTFTSEEEKFRMAEEDNIRQYLYKTEEPLSRGASLLKLAGITLVKPNIEGADFLEDMGFQDWQLLKSSKSPEISNEEKRMLRPYIGLLGDLAKQELEKQREFYKDAPEAVKEAETEERYVRSNVRRFIKSTFKDIRESVIAETAKERAGLLGKTKESKLYNYYREAYRSIPNDVKERAKRFFRKINERSPDFSRSSDTGLDDLRQMYELSKSVQSSD